MCTGLEIAGALGIVGGVLEGSGQQQAGEAAEAMQKRNAKVAKVLGKDALAVAQFDIGRYQQGVAELIGSQRVGYATQGIVLDNGAPVMLAADTMRTANIDEQMIYLNAIREKWGLEQDAYGFSAAGKAAKQAGQAGAIGSVLGGAAQGYGYMSLSTAGGGGYQ